jgi:ParB family chromosome partitioning protein
MAILDFKKDLPLANIDISPLNVRKIVTEENLEELGQSIKEIGIQQPIVVFPEGDRYKLIIGQRRYLASQRIGKKHIPAIIVEKENDTEATLASFSENIHRAELDYRDKMHVAMQLLKMLGDVSKVAKRLGVSQATVKNYLGYSAVPDEIKDMVSEKKLSASTAVRIAQNIPDKKMAINIAKKVMDTTSGRDRLLLIDAAKDNPNKNVTEISKIAEAAKRHKITLDLTPKVAEALDEASRITNNDRISIATWAIEEWLDKRGFLK